MRLAIISDIHGNHEAFLSVLQDIERRGVTTIYCLGDLIGYGPNPNEVVHEVAARKIETVLGNHELAIIDPSHLTWFNPTARESLEKTREMLSEETVAFISQLQSFKVDHGCRFVHGFPPDAITTYVFSVSDQEIHGVFDEMAEHVCFIGHTHLLELIRSDGERIFRTPLSKGILRLAHGHRYIVNIGSVGQPRDGNHDAKYVIHDTVDMTLELRHVPYDIHAVVAKMDEAGLPEAHANRLL